MKEQFVFQNRDDFRNWLTENQNRKDGIWVTFSKKSTLKTLKPDEALEEALCFGWIDGQYDSIDDAVYLKYFAPRGKGSQWSEKNKSIAEILITDGKMTCWGIQAIDRARKDGTWDAPQRPTITQEQIDSFTEAIINNKKAAENFLNMSMSVKKMFVGLYFDAKKEDTRKRRLEKLVGLLEQNKKPM